MTAKKLCTIEECEYCPYFEEIRITETSKNNPLIIGAEFYKCNKLKNSFDRLCEAVDKVKK